MWAEPQSESARYVVVKRDPVGNYGMNPILSGQTKSGGEHMEHQEITLGRVTYDISRVYAGSRPVVELVLNRLTQNLPTGHPVDGDPNQGL